MELDSKRFADAMVLYPVGRIDHATAEGFKAALVPYLTRCPAGGDRVVLDLSTRRLRGPGPERRVDAMGLFRVRGHLAGPTGRSEDVDLLVDTGATLLVVPRALATRLELVTRRSQPVLIAGGQRAIWPVAEAILTLEGLDVTTPCFIAPEGPALLGAVALESFFLGVDPVAKRLIPVEGMVG